MASRNWQSWIHPLATAAIVLGLMGGFPQPPRALSSLFKFELFKWFLMFVLIYQGGGAQDVSKSIVTTVIVYLVFKLLELKDAVDANVVVVQAPVVQAPPAPPMEQQQTAEKFYGGYYM